ncbi:hypothetical protein E4L95_12340 [Paracoccus liaowanqingii]|uniref:Uncharacterized protein n=1 Tax=Paracoccus liaowanqingii TaxID=2560053 RepID=A0A4Z1BUM8_9RHOB|nr:hypothetical protein [Paracoccus liaowanqingii]TGN58593.1 hypothetical protein E4L95_12340 [Paracoccus liaowanqingii]
MRNWNEVTQIVLSDAEAAPMAFLKALMGHLEHVDGATGALADALRDMGQIFQDEAEALEAEGRARGMNVVQMEGRSDA